ncbi:MAG: PSD1 and planctomycete cytochrome C domain-containing protein [Planctomycetota bacterium]|nr:PSD1 and planctomycete cytochrome C domain-containing protein [Planctomycetota bacterium]
MLPSHRGPLWLCSTFVILQVVHCQLCQIATCQQIDYSRDVRPILSDNCFRCHGPDENSREGDLRLDTPDGLQQESSSGDKVVLAARPNQSELIRRILADDESEIMPPPDSNKSLSAEEKELLVRWVQQGAAWQQHWSFEPPRLHGLPQPPGSDWCRNEIDHFILDQSVRAGLLHATDAEPYTLVRRLFLDLVGLPPSPEEADRWVEEIWKQDEQFAKVIDETAYQRLITRLMDAPEYGERWARRWLDLARYADTNGYEKDRDRSIWPYRDWVIDALNADMPFDQFTIEQLAGDMLPDASQEQRVATGFHRNTMLNEEGGIDPLEFRYHAMTDRVATTGTTWLGLTLGCCQCHTHKYDPISHTEYFQIMAFLNNADEPTLELPGADFEQRWQNSKRRASELVASLPDEWPLPKATGKKKEEVTEDSKPREGKASPEEVKRNEKEQRAELVQTAFERWLVAERGNATDWQLLRPLKATSNLPILTIQEDGAIFASGDTAKRDDYYVELAPQTEPIYAIEVETLPDERLPARGPGSTYYEGTLGDFYLTEIDFSVDEKTLTIGSASESFAANRFGNNPVSATLTFDGDIQTGWSVHGRQGERHTAVFVLKQPVPAGKSVRIHLSFGRHFASSFGLFRFHGTSSTNAPKARDHSREIQRLLLLTEAELQPKQKQRLFERFLLSAPELAKHQTEIRRLQRRPAVTTTLVMRERPANETRPTHRHHRGEFLQPEEQVQPATPSVLPGLGELPANRLGFAQWLVQEKHPLTARVFVNRTWAAFFGNGLVKTLDDFGFQGESPSHPELLDWLSVTWLEQDDWSIKSLHRRIVTSRTYRQSSRVTSGSRSLDPQNRLLTYFPRQRLEAEILRDSLLSTTGRLSLKRGGPPVRPPQPEGVTEVAYGGPKWNASGGADRFRRSIYTKIKRTAPFAMFSTFDAPSGEACVARRNRSNSPLQALTLLNDPMLVELAVAAGKQAAKEAAAEVGEPRTEQVLIDRFRHTLTRKPTEQEVVWLKKFLERQHAYFEMHTEEATKLLGENSVPKSSENPKSASSEAAAQVSQLAHQAAWTALNRALMALDETQNKN